VTSSASGCGRPALAFTGLGGATAGCHPEKKPAAVLASPGPAAPGRGSKGCQRARNAVPACDAFGKLIMADAAAPGPESTDRG